MRYIVFDAETTIRNRGDGAVGTLAASPFLAANRMVCYGERWRVDGSPVTSIQYDALGVTVLPEFLHVATSGQDVLLVGQNITFDLLWLFKTFPAEMFMALPHLYIWDIQQVQYLLSGQTHLYASLDEMCIELGLEVKDDRIKAYWKSGLDTDMIPKDELVEYQEHDVNVTELVFRDQWEQVRSNPNMFMLVKAKMDDILMTTLMTWNGMKFDLVKAQRIVTELDRELEALGAQIRETAGAMFPPDYEWSPTSTQDVSRLLFGGTVGVERSLPKMGADGLPERYKGGQKAGQVKTRKEKVIVPVKGLGLKPPRGIPEKAGLYSTADEWLAKLKHPVVKLIQDLREKSKDAETYFRGYSALVWPDGCIHPQRNHCSTVTGRLSCNGPNLENVSKDDD